MDQNHHKENVRILSHGFFMKIIISSMEYMQHGVCISVHLHVHGYVCESIMENTSQIHGRSHIAPKEHRFWCIKDTLLPVYLWKYKQAKLHDSRENWNGHHFLEF